MLWFICIFAAYLIGGIPFGYIIGRVKGVDIREHGSKNIGATNVGRILGKPWAVVCFLLDGLKGAGPVVVGEVVMGLAGRSWMDIMPLERWGIVVVAAATVLGHIFTPYLGFKGGKGVATAFGAMLGVWPLLTLPALAAFGIWFVVRQTTRIVSLASMTAVVAMPMTCAVMVAIMPWMVEGATPRGSSVAERLMCAAPALVVGGALAILVVVKHRTNIGRILRGEEPKVKKSVREP